MPHASIKLVGGANTQETPALNENGGIQSTQLIRYFYDPNGLSLVGKLGGWTKFYNLPFTAPVTALWAWEDIDLEAHLAIGQGDSSGLARLYVETNNSLQNITPTVTDTTGAITALNISTTFGSALVTITTTFPTSVTNSNSIYIATQIAIGGLVLFGLYQCDPDNSFNTNHFTIYATDILGNLTPATSTSSTPVLPLFNYTINSTSVEVTLPGYTYAVGDTFPILIPTVATGFGLYGNYIVASVIDSSHFTITSNTLPLQTGSVQLYGGSYFFLYSGSSSGPPGVAPLGTLQDWTFDNFGADLVACPVGPLIGDISFQPIYVWPPGPGIATVIPQAPPVNDGIFVAMPQRQIVAWGSTQTGIQDPLLISWCDVGNFNQWIPLVTNQAGSYRIPSGSKIVGCLQGPQQAFVWTDIDLWSMQYIGPPYVYSFNKIGTGCGMIARKAACTLNGIAYWMGFSQFYLLSATGVQILPCSVWDVIFQNLNKANATNIRAAVNSRFSEIMWFYPSTASSTGQNDSYVKYNTQLNVWDFGSLPRSAWIDQSVLGPPIGYDPVKNYLYQHETSNDADGVAMNPSFQTGYYALSEGDYKSFVDWVWPDMKWGQYGQAQTATVQITFLVADYPGDTPIAYGPYSVTQATEYFYTRFRGRLVAVNVSSNDLGSFWRIGNIRYRFAPDGRI
jgi:hypothetical protein